MAHAKRSVEEAPGPHRSLFQWERWRAQAFGPASEEPYRRRTSDWIRLSVAAVVLGLLIAHEGHATSAERDAFTFFNHLPHGLSSLFKLSYGIGALWAVAVVVAAALVARRWRLARDLALAGIAAWVLARFIGVLVADQAGLARALRVVMRFYNAAPSFPLVRLAVVVAVVATAAPYLTRPVRRCAWVLAALMAVAAMYLGTAFPVGILAAWVLGWGVQRSSTSRSVHRVDGQPRAKSSARSPNWAWPPKMSGWLPTSQWARPRCSPVTIVGHSRFGFWDATRWTPSSWRSSGASCCIRTGARRFT